MLEYRKKFLGVIMCGKYKKEKDNKDNNNFNNNLDNFNSWNILLSTQLQEVEMAEIDN